MRTPSDSDQGRMSSPTLNALLQRAVASSHPELDVAGLDKVHVLRAVMERHGWAAVLALGQTIHELRAHPVLRALTTLADPAAVVERWIRLERFGHSRNRTELAARHVDANTVTLTLRHVALDGGHIVAVNDLFIWGLLVALLELAGVTAIEAALVDAEQRRFALIGDRRVVHAPLPAATNTLVLSGHLRASGLGRVGASQDGRDANTITRRLAALLDQDLLRTWTVAEAARALAMSTRSLQRSLLAEGASFSEVMQRTRVERAQALLTNPSMSLTEIAFCVGFADQAHFTRVFRRFSDVPPSALRDILPMDES